MRGLKHSSLVQMSTKFDMRGDENVIRNYGRMLVELAAAIPDGIVCFFVSYSYMDSIVSRWNDMGILKVLSPCCRAACALLCLGLMYMVYWF